MARKPLSELVFGRPSLGFFGLCKALKTLAIAFMFSCNVVTIGLLDEGNPVWLDEHEGTRSFPC